jgi:hypothetical protein
MPDNPPPSSELMGNPSSTIATISSTSWAVPAKKAFSTVILALLVYYALFRLPFRFPPQVRLMSASYTFGFNNSIAILALAALLAATSVWYLLRPAEPNKPLLIFRFKGADRHDRFSTVAFLVLVLCYAGVTWVMYVYDVGWAPSLTWETRHLLHRTLLMDLYKLRPYTEIAAEYGPILTYAPLYTYWLLKPLGASHLQAYFICHLILNLAGLWCAYYVLSRAVMPARCRVISLVVIAAAGFGLYMGINGVLLRYLFPFASLLLGHRAITLTLSHGRHAMRWVGAGVAVLVLLSANVLISPEVGIAFALAWIGYAVLSIRFDIRVLAVSVIGFLATGLLCWLFLPFEYYGTLLRFSEGANNLPLVPAAHLLLYILTMFLLVPKLVARSFREPRGGDVPGAAIGGALAALCVVMAPGALGRCDPPHVLFYGMGASILLMVELGKISGRAFTSYIIAYVAIFIVLLELVNLRVFYGISPAVLLSRHPIARVVEAVHSATATEHPSPATLSALDRYPRLGLPYASFGDPAVERYVISRGQLQPEYYVAIVGVYDTAALERKLLDVGKMEYLLMPNRFVRRSTPHMCSDYLLGLRRWFFYPAKLPCRFDPLDPYTSLNTFIADHYVTVAEVGSWSVLHRISASSNASADQ